MLLEAMVLLELVSILVMCDPLMGEVLWAMLICLICLIQLLIVESNICRRGRVECCCYISDSCYLVQFSTP